MLPLIAIAAGAAIAGVLGIAARRPDTFRVQRTAVIDAPPEKIHPLIVDFGAGRSGRRTRSWIRG